MLNGITKKLGLFCLLINILGCNNVGSSGNTATSNDIASSNGTANNKSLFGTSENKVYFKGVRAWNGSFFELNDWKITQGQEWGGIKPLTEEVNDYDEVVGVSVFANRKGSDASYKWLYNLDYGGMAPYMGITMDFDEFEANDFNFALKGNLQFVDNNNDAQKYVCPNVALAQIGLDMNNIWFFFSNIKPGLASSVLDTALFTSHETPTDIDCINQNNKIHAIYTVTATGRNEFTIIQKYYNETSGFVLDTPTLIQVIGSTFNGLPLLQKFAMFSYGTYQLQEQPYYDFYVYNLNLPALKFSPEITTKQQNDQVVKYESTIFAATTELINDTVYMQTMISQPMSYNYSSSITTNNTQTYKIEGTSEINGKTNIILVGAGFSFSVTVGWSGAWGKSEQEGYSYTYTLPSQNIYLPAHTKAYITSYLAEVSYTGTFNFYEKLLPDQTLGVDGMLFFSDYATPRMYSSENLTPGVIDIYNTLAATTQPLPPQILIDQATQAVLFTGVISYTGSIGTHYTAKVVITDILNPKNVIESYTIDDIEPEVTESSVESASSGG